jgi:hypothetical protein
VTSNGSNMPVTALVTAPRLFPYTMRIPRHENNHSELKKIIVPR